MVLYNRFPKSISECYCGLSGLRHWLHHNINGKYRKISTNIRRNKPMAHKGINDEITSWWPNLMKIFQKLRENVAFMSAFVQQTRGFATLHAMMSTSNALFNQGLEKLCQTVNNPRNYRIFRHSHHPLCSSRREISNIFTGNYANGLAILYIILNKWFGR